MKDTELAWIAAGAALAVVVALKWLFGWAR